MDNQTKVYINLEEAIERINKCNIGGFGYSDYNKGLEIAIKVLEKVEDSLIVTGIKKIILEDNYRY